MKKSYLKELLKSRDVRMSAQLKVLKKQKESIDKFQFVIKNLKDEICERNKVVETQYSTIQKHKSFIKDLEHKLSLAAELNDQKDLEIEKLHSVIIDSKVSIPFIKETKHELFESEKDDCVSLALDSLSYMSKNTAYSPKKEVVDAPTTFSSRFMSNVKFNAIGSIRKDFAEILIDSGRSAILGLDFYKITKDGFLIAMPNKITFDYSEEIEVSIYEAIPELVPKGMVYDKESDSLVYPRGMNPSFVPLDEVAFINEQLLQDPEAFESFLAKAASRIKNIKSTGTEYDPDDVSLKKS